MKWQQKHTSLVIISIGFASLFFIFHKQWMHVPIGTCFISFLLGNVGKLIHLTWMILAKVLGFINSRILLTVLLFSCTNTFSFAMRVLGKENFIRVNPTDSTFIQRNHLFIPNGLQNPF